MVPRGRTGRGEFWPTNTRKDQKKKDKRQNKKGDRVSVRLISHPARTNESSTGDLTVPPTSSRERIRCLECSDENAVIRSDFFIRIALLTVGHSHFFYFSARQSVVDKVNKVSLNISRTPYIHSVPLSPPLFVCRSGHDLRLLKLFLLNKMQVGFLQESTPTPRIWK